MINVKEGPGSVGVEEPQIKGFSIVGVARTDDVREIQQVAIPFVRGNETALGDVCSVRWIQTGDFSHRVYTSHGHVSVTLGSSNKTRSVKRVYPWSWVDNQSARVVGSTRERLTRGLEESLGITITSCIPTKGRVFLCGDFRGFPLFTLLALRQIFLERGARELTFVSPALSRQIQGVLGQKPFCSCFCLSPVQ